MRSWKQVREGRQLSRSGKKRLRGWPCRWTGEKRGNDREGGKKRRLCSRRGGEGRKLGGCRGKTPGGGGGGGEGVGGCGWGGVKRLFLSGFVRKSGGVAVEKLKATVPFRRGGGSKTDGLLN